MNCDENKSEDRKEYLTDIDTGPPLENILYLSMFRLRLVISSSSQSHNTNVGVEFY